MISVELHLAVGDRNSLNLAPAGEFYSDRWPAYTRLRSCDRSRQNSFAFAIKSNGFSFFFTEKQTNLIESSVRSGGSNSSLNSVGSGKSVERSVFGKNETFTKKVDSTSEVTPKQQTRSINHPPVIPPRPKQHRLRPRSITVGQLPISDANSGNSTVVRSPSPTELLSVSEKALIFGGTKRKSVPKENLKRYLKLT